MKLWNFYEVITLPLSLWIYSNCVLTEVSLMWKEYRYTYYGGILTFRVLDMGEEKVRKFYSLKDPFVPKFFYISRKQMHDNSLITFNGILY